MVLNSLGSHAAVDCQGRAAFEQRFHGAPPCEASKPLGWFVCAGVLSSLGGAVTAARLGLLGNGVWQ